jgi:glutamate decarboxylase
LIHPFIKAADIDASSKFNSQSRILPEDIPHTSLVEQYAPQELEQILRLEFPENGASKQGLLKVVQNVLRYSVNTWNQGFMDKLYASTNAVRGVLWNPS